jgi:hypothetical protein
MSMGLLSRLFGFAAADADPVADAVERLVDSVSPRLRLASGYRQTLRPAVETALDFARRFVEALPPGREASAAAWGGDPALRAFFATAGDLPLALGRSDDLRDWLDAHPLAETAWALLRMDYAERRVLGMALVGDTVQREVTQTTVSFSAHRARVIAEDEATLRVAIEHRAIDQLGLLALARLGDAQDRRNDLQSERSLLAARLRLLQRGGVGLAPVRDDDAAAPATVTEIEAELERNARELEASGAGAARLDADLRCVADALAMLPRHVRVERCRIRLDSMNVLVDGSGGDAGREVEFARVQVGESQSAGHAFAVVRVPRGEPEAPPPLAEATRGNVP